MDKMIKKFMDMNFIFPLKCDTKIIPFNEIINIIILDIKVLIIN